MSDPLLTVSDLRVHLPSNRGMVRAIDGLDLSLGRGESLGLVGESGSGKTMTSLAIMGLLPPTARIISGQVCFEGNDLLKLDEAGLRRIRGHQIGMTFQDPSSYLNPVLKIGDQIAEAVNKAEDPDVWKRVEEVLDLVRLPAARKVVDLYPHELSGGMRQRILLAIALAARPRLLIADEPTTALDVTIQAQILDLIERLQEELNLSLLLVSHDLGVIARVCRRVSIMYAGRILEDASAGALFAKAQHPYTQGLLRSTLSVKQRRQLSPMPGTVPDLTALPRGCRFAPRCPSAMAICEFTEPPMFPTGAGDLSRCWLHDPVVVAEQTAGQAAVTPAGPERLQLATAIPRASPIEPVDPLVRVTDVRRYFVRRAGLFFGDVETTRAVDGVSLDIRPGEIFALVGESGSGKSTLGRMILRLLATDSGAISFDGRPLLDLDRRLLAEVRPQMQMVFQDTFASLNPRRSVYESVAQPIELHRLLPRNMVSGRVHDVLEAMGLTPASMYAGRFPHELSGGQRQRVALARALVTNPRLIVADEPVASLDVSVRAQALSLIEETRRSLGVAFLFITHDLGVVRAIADRLAVMYLGQIVEAGPTDRILQDPRHPYTQALLDSTPVPDPVLSQQLKSRVIQGEIPSATRPPGGCRFHPRCPFSMPVCESLEPIRGATEADAAWSVACHRAQALPEYVSQAAARAGSSIALSEAR